MPQCSLLVANGSVESDQNWARCIWKYRQETKCLGNDPQHLGAGVGVKGVGVKGVEGEQSRGWGLGRVEANSIQNHLVSVSMHCMARASQAPTQH